MEQLTKLLKTHNGYYDYSDNMETYSQGRDERGEIVTIIMNLENLEYSKAVTRYEELIKEKYELV